MLGKGVGRRPHAPLHDQIEKAFADRWVHRGTVGPVGSGSRTSYVLALKLGLVPDDLKTGAFHRLGDDVTSRGYSKTLTFTLSTTTP